jgi:hypothetical protein
MDLREQIAIEVHHAKPLHQGCSGDDRIGDAVWTNVVEPALAAKDAEIARLREDLAEANHLVGKYMAAAQIAEHQRQRAERAEAANTRGLEVLRVWRDERTLEPQTARFLYEVGAALAQPDQEGTGT